jgi:hypothetical protein
MSGSNELSRQEVDLPRASVQDDAVGATRVPAMPAASSTERPRTVRLPAADLGSFGQPPRTGESSRAEGRRDATVVQLEPASAPAKDVFETLVCADDDVRGMLAYGLYKRSKREWLARFRATEGRAPTEAEVRAFLAGELMPRRLALYQMLADDLLLHHAAGRMPPPAAAPAPIPAAPLPAVTAVPQPSRKGVWLLAAVVLALLALAAPLAWQMLPR